jgi:hypothetical protein
MPTVLWNDINQIILSWTLPSDNGGSPIIGYQLYMKKTTESTFIQIYDGSYKPATTFYTIKTYNNSPLSSVNYDFQLLALNIIGNSGFSPILTILAQNLPYGPNCQVSGTALSSFPSNTNVSLNVKVKLFLT